MKQVFIKDWEKLNFCKKVYVLRKYKIYNHTFYAIKEKLSNFEPVVVELSSGKRIGLFSSAPSKKALRLYLDERLERYKDKTETKEMFLNRRCKEAEQEFLQHKANK